VGVRGEENPEFHAVSSLRHRFYRCPSQHGALHGTFLRRTARTGASSAMMNQWRAWDIIAHESALSADAAPSSPKMTHTH
jgi:hypothetical protein